MLKLQTSKLLISVKDLAEADLASHFPIGILDFKNPKAGSLGAVPHDCVSRIVSNLRLPIPLSLALGELWTWFENPSDATTIKMTELRNYLNLLHRFSYVKVGLAHSKQLGSGWQDNWLVLRNMLPLNVTLVAVAYADHITCEAPSLEELFIFLNSDRMRSFNTLSKRDLAETSPIDSNLESHRPKQVVLIDTYHKTSGSLWDWYKIDQLTALSSRLRRCNIRLAIAGSLELDHIGQLLDTGCDWIGFRGAICRQGRNELDPLKLRKLFRQYATIGGLSNSQ